MKILMLAALGAVLALGSLACKKAPEAPKQAAFEPKAGETHSAKGVIKEFGEGSKVVVIQHEAFADGFMEGMTMSFELRDPAMAKGLKVGDKVEFTLTYSGKGFPITKITKIK